jgi:tripartite-type tricarboxylate transporter receptor subunit TctC
MVRNLYKGLSGILLCSIIFTVMPVLCFSQQYPAKAVNMYVGMAPGGATDIAIRAITAAAEKHLGQSILVSNKGGGQGGIAYGLIAKEKPDGYHLTGNSSTGLLYVPHIREVAYGIDDFTFVCIFGKAPGNGLVVKASSPYKTLKELVEYARKNPGDVTYGTSGVGGGTHLAMEYIAKQEGVKWTHIPYKGSSEVLAALLGGHITAQSAGVKEFEDHIKSGAIRVLATYEEKRMLPEIPTLRELGYNYTIEIAWVVAAPKGTPAPVIKKLDEAFRKGQKDPKFLETMKNMQMEVVYLDSAQTKTFLKDTSARIGKFIRELNIPREPGGK